jgi:hypothetical protein
MQQGPSAGPQPPRGTHWAPPEQRPPGEVRIERVDDRREQRPSGPVQDADFEEIK